MNRQVKWLGQVDDPCASFNAAIAQVNSARSALLAQKPALQQAAAAASLAGDNVQATFYAQQVAAIDAEVMGMDGQLVELKAALADCKKLTPGCTAPDGSTTPECPAGQICVGGKCVTPGTPVTPQCSATNPCPAGQTCVDGTCVPTTPPATKKSSSSGLGLLILGGAAAAGVLFLGPAIFGKGGINQGMARADAARAGQLLENRRRSRRRHGRY